MLKQILTLILFSYVVASSSFSFAVNRSTNTGNEQMAVSSGSIYFLNESQINELSDKANKGDADSAFKLYLYYQFSIYDEEKRIEWLIVAANNNHSVAQYNYAKHLLSENKLKEAMYWAQEAKKREHVLADGLINQIDKSLQSE